MKPMLMRSGLTDRLYIVTRYKDRGEGRYEAVTKYEVTDAELEACGPARSTPAEAPDVERLRAVRSSEPTDCDVTREKVEARKDQRCPKCLRLPHRHLTLAEKTMAAWDAEYARLRSPESDR